MTSRTSYPLNVHIQKTTAKRIEKRNHKVEPLNFNYNISVAQGKQENTEPISSSQKPSQITYTYQNKTYVCKHFISTNTTEKERESDFPKPSPF